MTNLKIFPRIQVFKAKSFQGLSAVILAIAFSLSLSSVKTCAAAQGKYDHTEGKYLDPQVKTNINIIDPLFDEKIDDFRTFEKDLKDHKGRVSSSIGNSSGIQDIPGSANAKDNADNLSKLNANELGSRGNLEATRNEWTKDIFVDYSKPGHMQIKKDMDSIAEKSSELMTAIFSKLRDIGLDCKSVKGNKQIDPEYFIDLKERTLRDKGETVYDPHYCEQVSPEYNCRDTLEMRCLQFSDTPMKFEITNSNIMYRVRQGSDYTSYEFTNKGCFEGVCASGGGTLTSGFGNSALNAIGLGIQKGSSTTYHSSEAFVTVNFKLSTDTPLDAISKIELANAQFTTLMLVKVNGHTALVSPYPGDKLELSGQHEEVVKGDRKFGGVFGGRVKHKSYYPKVDTGSQTVILGKIPNNNSLQVTDLKQYLNEGDNTIEIKVIGLNQALVSFSLNAYQKTCLRWSEDWSEKCTLN